MNQFMNANSLNFLLFFEPYLRVIGYNVNYLKKNPIMLRRKKKEEEVKEEKIRKKSANMRLKLKISITKTD